MILIWNLVFKHRGKKILPFPYAQREKPPEKGVFITIICEETQSMLKGREPFFYSNRL